eukprot:CAMPEP_0176300408 /NCGR_PEP_ID=MMETSP0121_2-20121125/60307_1 /TAXON_ID=160619 /ORGANISM="Kryptoperidinium foliaceum, Strain CCMP 1326" /LENGTH=431 /DNA_ID=CAMNT_0017641797 /DNA_START=47 /DNA_END=1338 /DNA_ORIENTATION=-
MAMVQPGMPMMMPQQRVGNPPVYSGGMPAGQPYPGQPFPPQYAGQPRPPQVMPQPGPAQAAYQQMPMAQAPPGAPRPALAQQAQLPQAPLTASVSMQQNAVMQPKPQTVQSGVLPPQQAGVLPPQERNPVPPAGAKMPPMTAREQQLEQRVADLEARLAQKDQEVKELRQKLAKAEGRPAGPTSPKRKSVAAAAGFRKLTGAMPASRYTAVDRRDPVDVQLEEFYNGTGSAVPFRRINRGFYRFGETIVELSIVNNKLMARTEDGWNRGHVGPIEKFLGQYENLEREKAGLEPEAAAVSAATAGGATAAAAEFQRRRRERRRDGGRDSSRSRVPDGLRAMASWLPPLHEPGAVRRRGRALALPSSCGALAAAEVHAGVAGQARVDGSTRLRPPPDRLGRVTAGFRSGAARAGGGSRATWSHTSLHDARNVA